MFSCCGQKASNIPAMDLLEVPFEHILAGQFLVLGDLLTPAGACSQQHTHSANQPPTRTVKPASLLHMSTREKRSQQGLFLWRFNTSSVWLETTRQMPWGGGQL